ncbi:MAG: DUF4340 domain-containing protein [Bryobacterales bacterium]|nr:DUF4340 domain-containing protein [Bryobacteraceae bacterium]MDW8354002.1 DUF4340 domain-containing protein [Bryobacterales bacterium]
MREGIKTAAFAAVALVLSVVAALRQPEAATPRILSDQGELFYPNFRDPAAVRSIEILDYDEATATARPFKVAFERGRWVIASHHNYPVEAADRMARTAAALLDLRKDGVVSDSAEQHGRYGVIDPLDTKVTTLVGRGKRVTLRDRHGAVLADFVFGKPVEGKPGYRYVRVPGQKRTYAVKTDADPSARFADWVEGGLLRLSAASIRKIAVHRYQIDELAGRLTHVRSVTVTREGGQWKASGEEPVNITAAQALASALSGLRAVDVRPKPPTLAEDLRAGKIALTLEAALSLRQRGFFLTPGGRLLANAGEVTVETDQDVIYTLRFGEVSGSADPRAADGAIGDNRFLLLTARAAKEAAEPLARSLNDRFAGWYYVITNADYRTLTLQTATPLRGK